MDPIFRFVDVERAFGSTAVLRGLSFEVGPGEVFALVGRNGCGKTTAIRLLLGLLEPDQGRCEVFACESRSLPDAQRDAVGFVGVGYGPYPTMRVREAVDFEAGTRSAFDRAFALRAVNELDLEATRRVRELSHGQRAQLALVLAVAQRPRLLVLDEPTQGLDVVVRRQFLDSLIDLVGGLGTSVLLTSHVFSDVERVADRIGVLHGGRLVCDVAMEALRGSAQRRAVRLKPGVAALPALATLIARRDIDGAIELTFASLDADDERRLADAAVTIGAPAPLGLEQVFVALASERGAAFPSLLDEVTP